jgi:hypothetical protein
MNDWWYAPEVPRGAVSSLVASDAGASVVPRSVEEPDEGTLRELASVLWEQRRLLGELEFKLEEAELVAAAGRHRWLGRATAEVESVLERLDGLEARRSAAVAALAARLGMEDAPTLATLAAAIGGPWGETLRAHRLGLVRALERVQQVAERHRRTLMVHHEAVRAALGMLGAGGPGPYEHPERHARAGRRAQPGRVVDARA